MEKDPGNAFLTCNRLKNVTVKSMTVEVCKWFKPKFLYFLLIFFYSGSGIHLFFSLFSLIFHLARYVGDFESPIPGEVCTFNTEWTPCINGFAKILMKLIYVLT